MSQILANTSLPTSRQPSSPGALRAQDGPSEDTWVEFPVSGPSSPALSTASTAEGSVSSPELPPLRAPRLPENVQELLRTPSPNSEDDNKQAQGRSKVSNWGSPYPRHLRQETRSASSEEGLEDDSEEEELGTEGIPIHRLDLQTPFLRPVSSSTGTGSATGSGAQETAERESSSLVSAAVLANRARRPARGITEDWIRQHTAGVDEEQEPRHWLSDGSGGSGTSSLSGSPSYWLHDSPDLQTPRASTQNPTPSRKSSRRYPRNKSSTETLRQAHLQSVQNIDKMETTEEIMTPDSGSVGSVASIEVPVVQQEVQEDDVQKPQQQDVHSETNHGTENVPLDSAVPSTPTRTVREDKTEEHTQHRAQNQALPVTPARPLQTAKRTANANATPRVKKKVPWKGKSIMVLLPHLAEGGPFPLDSSAVASKMQEWENLGYNIRGFDLDGPQGVSSSPELSQSRGAWPDFDEVSRERAERSYKVALPDLNAWKTYVDELQEAKLRALGVSFSDDPPAPSISPANTMSRRASITHYPSPLPFSPPIPTSSASSNHGNMAGASGFPFGQYPGNSSAHSPGIPGLPSPFAPGKFGHNPRASIAVSSPHGLGWSPQLMMQHGIPRGGSPGLARFGSPSSPFSPDGISGPPMHQRHMSMQYSMLPQQFQHSARASPRLQELQEEDEEVHVKSPSKTPEAPHMGTERPNSSDSLQQEIDEAEYHLEEQMRSQLDNDQDYSPHNDRQTGVVGLDGAPGLGHQEPLVQFSPQVPRFMNDSEGTVLHHPRPHSRGHSLSTKYFTEEDVAANGAFRPDVAPIAENRMVVDDEVETNPSNLGTPVQEQHSFDFGKPKFHDRSFSTASNPWNANASESTKPITSATGSRAPSHGSKASFSKLNVAAPEFKFNPTNTFQPGAGLFSFGTTAMPNAFQPAVFNAQAPLSATSSQFSFNALAPPVVVPAVPAPVSSSKINVNAPAFSPGQSEFSFLSTGPKFRADAPAFVPPSSIPASLPSPLSGAESSNTAGSIFGSIDLNNSAIIKPPKRSKAVAIQRPRSRESPSPKPEPEFREDANGRMLQDESRFKRFRASAKDGDEVPLFAPRPEDEEEATPVPDARPVSIVNETKQETQDDQAADDGLMEDTSFDDNLKQTESIFSSTKVSETTGTDTKATVSPSQTSPDPGSIPWAPFEFRNTAEVQSFNDARPFGESSFKKGHKNSLSATANAFVPGATLWGPLSSQEQYDDSADEDHHEVVEDTLELPLESVDQAVEDKVEEHLGAEAPAAVSEEMPVPVQQAPAPMPEPAPVRKGLAASRFASPPPVVKGLSASRFASIPTPPPATASPDVGLSSPPAAEVSESAHEEDTGGDVEEQDQQLSPMAPHEENDETMTLPLTSSPSLFPAAPVTTSEQFAADEASMADIDAIMAHLNANPNMGVRKVAEPLQWDQPSPTRHIGVEQLADSSPVRLPPQGNFRSDAPSPSPRRYRELPGEVQEFMAPPQMEDPFLDPPQRDGANDVLAQVDLLSDDMMEEAAVDSRQLPNSDWDGAFTEDEQTKLEGRVTFFDGHVQEVVGHLLDHRLGPLEDTLDDIRTSLASMSHKTKSRSTHRERRSTSAEVQESDADDEDEDVALWPPRSMSPKRDRKMEQIRAAVLDALATQQQRHIPAAASQEMDMASATHDHIPTAVVKALEDMKEQFSQSLHLDFRGEDLRNIVEEAVERRMPPTQHANPDEVDTAASQKAKEMQARIDELEWKLRSEGDRVEKEIDARRAAEERSADLSRRLESAETRIEIEIMNKSAFDQRLNDLEDKLHQQEAKTEEQLQGKRTAEDRLSEVQRLLRIASEEESRLRDLVEEKEQRVKTLEASHGKTAMRLTLLENAQSNSQQSQSELQNRLNISEVELRDARQEARHWKGEAERLMDASTRHEADLEHVVGENRAMRKLLDTLGTQLQENEKMRDTWRTRFLALQDDMAVAAREIEEDNSQRIKKEQTLIARQEVLEARLQAEAKTRERIEMELERLEKSEREGFQIVNENKRLELLVADLRAENQKIQQSAHRFKAEFEEARESGAREVQRTRESMQAELEEANHQVNVVREELEDMVTSLRNQLDKVKLDADTAQSRYDMLLEEAQDSTQVETNKLMIKHQSELQELAKKHQNEMDDAVARLERQLNNTTEDAQRTEQNLLERLSISTSKSEYLQDKVTHLQEKLEIAQEAAKAAASAAQATRSASTSSSAMPDSVTSPVSVPAPMPVSRGMGPPEKVSPQALRESIMVLQEQLQERELRLEELEQELAKVDPDADIKISKRDDEITWLRELLAVRHSDLNDIILALQRNDYDRSAVKDAAIRLKANLQMEEQERERAMNGASAINLPNIAATIRDAATPRVAQAVGPLAAAWGNWRKSRETSTSFSSTSPGPLAMAPPPGHQHRVSTSSRSTPSRPSPTSQNSFLGGLLTPPTSNMRQTPPSDHHSSKPLAPSAQPTAFSSTGRRFTGSQSASRARGPSMTAKQPQQQQPLGATPPRQTMAASPGPVTPPMMRPSAYDSDAHVEEFDDAGFFEDD